MDSRKTFLKKLALLGGSGLAGLSASGGRTQRVRPAGAPGYSGTLLKPKPLKRGDTVGLVSPGSTLPDPGEYESVAESVRSLGFRVREGAHTRNRWGNFGARDRQRAEDLHEMFRDPEVDAVMAVRGGWGSNRILPLLDFSVIKDNPKALIGFSDITSLLLSVYERIGMVTFHGPVGRSDWTPYTVRSFRRALQEGGAYTLRNDGHSGGTGGHVVLRDGSAEGVLLGGNLTVLASMIGTGYLPDFDGALLFLEEVGEDYYRIDRMLTQLSQNGILDGIRGFVFGHCTECSRGTPRSHGLEEVIRHHILPRDVPALHAMQFGHISETLTLPVGVQARLDAGEGSLTLLESPTSPA